MSEAKQSVSDLYPSLTYADAPAAIEWLCRVFGFEKRLVVPLPDGGVMHSELSFGTSVVMVSSPRPDMGRVSPEWQNGRCLALSVFVEDPDAHYQHTLDEGAEIVMELCSEEYGARGYMASDLGGYHWYFADYRPGAFWDSAE